MVFSRFYWICFCIIFLAGCNSDTTFKNPPFDIKKKVEIDDRLYGSYELYEVGRESKYELNVSIKKKPEDFPVPAVFYTLDDKRLWWPAFVKKVSKDRYWICVPNGPVIDWEKAKDPLKKMKDFKLALLKKDGENWELRDLKDSVFQQAVEGKELEGELVKDSLDEEFLEGIDDEEDELVTINVTSSTKKVEEFLKKRKFKAKDFGQKYVLKRVKEAP